MKKIPDIETSKCIKCNSCVQSCPQSAVSVALNTVCAKCIKYCIAFPVPCLPEYLVFDYSLCNSCGLCIKACPNDALHWSTSEKVAERKRERE